MITPLSRSTGCLVEKYINSDFDHVVNVAEHMDQIKNVEANQANIDNVSDHMTQVVNVSNNMEHVVAVSTDMETVKAVHADEVDIGKVADNITEVVQVANGMEEYQVIEHYTLEQGQTTVQLDNILAQTAKVEVMGQMVDGTVLLRNTDFTVTAIKRIDLTRSYPKGTIIKITQVVYKNQDDPYIVIDELSAFNRKTLPIGIDVDISPYDYAGGTVTPRLLVKSISYVAIDPIPANTLITSINVTSEPEGVIVVRTTNGDIRFSSVLAEAFTREEIGKAVTITYPYFAAGGESTINVPYLFDNVQAVYINGLRQVKDYSWEWKKEDGRNVTIAEELLNGDLVEVIIGGEYEQLLPPDINLSDVYGVPVFNLVNGLVISPNQANMYPKLKAFNAIYELADNSVAYTIKSFTQSVGLDCVITLTDDSLLIAKKVDAASREFVKKSIQVSTVLSFGSVHKMLSGTLHDGFSHKFKVGDKCSSGGTTWEVKSISSPMTVGDFVALTTVVINDFVEDRVTDCSDEFQSAFNAARASNIDSKASGEFYIAKRCSAFTSCDLSEATIKIDNNFYQTGREDDAVIHVAEPDTQIIEGFNLGSLVKNQTTIPSLAQFGICTVTYESTTDRAYYRINNKVIYKSDIFYSVDGSIASTPSLYSITNAVKLTVKPIRQWITLKAPVFDVTVARDRHPLETFILLERNNVEVIGGHTNTYKHRGASIQTAGAFIRSLNCGFHSIRGWSSSGADKDFSYTIHLIRSFECSISNIVDPTNWALVDGFVMRKTSVKNCTGSRIGGHYDQVDFTVENYTDTLKGIIVNGHGTLKIDGYSSVIHGRKKAISNRGDYGWCWNGTYSIKNVRLDISNMTDGAALLELQASHTNSYCYEENVNLPNKVDIKSIEFVNSTPLGSKGAFRTIVYNIGFAQPTLMPKKIVIEDVRETGLKVVPLLFSKEHPLSTHTNCLSIRTVYKMKNLENLETNTTNMLFDANAVVKNPVTRIYKNHENLNIRARFPHGYEIVADNCKIKFIDGYNSGDNFGKLTIKNSEIVGEICQWSPTNDNDGWFMTNNNFTNVGVETRGLLSVASLNTVDKDAVLIGKTEAELWSYKSASFK